MSKIILSSDINVTRANAKATITKLIDTHRQTMHDIREGKKFWAGGEDVTEKIYKRCQHEILCCYEVLNAVDLMKAGQIKRAADLCLQIEEHLPRS